MQRVSSRTARRAAAALGRPPQRSFPDPPSELVARLTRFHAAERSKDEAEEQSRAVIRWMQESPKCGNESDLKRMVDAYVDKQTPLAYILGTQPFGNLDLLIEPPTLIPRPETEEWTMGLLQNMKKQSKTNIVAPARILDLCSGSGCISLCLAKEAPDFFVTGLDISEKAIELSKKNALRNKLGNVIFKQVDIFNDTEIENARLTKYDLIVSNPPYITPTQYETLDRSVKGYEDVRALVGKYQNPKNITYEPPQGSGEAGLDFYHRIRELAEKLLSPEKTRVFTRSIPRLVLEFGKGQAGDVQEIFKDYRTEIRKDFNDIDRTIDIYDKRM